MKRIVFFIAIIAMCLSSCGKEINDTNEEKGESTEIVSENATINGEQDIDKDFDKVAVIKHSDDFGLKMYEFNLENSIDQADQIVKAHVTDTSYYLDEDYPHTILTITIDESLYGDLKRGDVVTVHELGGLFTYDDYLDYFGINPDKFEYQNVDMIKELYYQKDLHNIGDEAIICLRNADEGFSNVVDYTMPCSSVSFLQYYEDMDSYMLIGTDGKEDTYYTYDEIIEQIAEFKDK